MRTACQAQRAKGLEHHPKQNNSENTNIHESRAFIFLAALGVSKLQSNVKSVSHNIVQTCRSAFVKEKYILDRQIGFKIKTKR